ncbi:retrotransposon protein, putative, ty1-copia subclass [Tanacetum coccineum]
MTALSGVWIHGESTLKRIFCIPIPPAPVTGFTNEAFEKWNKIYDVHNEVSCLMLRSMTPELHRQFENSSFYDMFQELKSMFKKQAGVERFDLIQTFHACKQEEGKSVSSYVLKMKGYVEQLERLGYVLPQEISVGLILNGVTSDFSSFVRSYNMHNMGKTVGELYVMLIEYEDGLLKKGKGKEKGNGKNKLVYVPKPKNPKPAAKEHPGKDDACHHCKEVGHWKRNCPVYLANLMKKKKQVGTASTSVSKNDVLYFNDIPRDRIYEIDMLNLVPKHCRLAHISKKHIEKLQHDGLLKSTDSESFNQCLSSLSGYPKETMGYYFYFPLENKIVVARYTEFLEKNLISQEASGRAVELEEIQDEDTSLSENTSKIPDQVEGFEPPQEEIAPIRRSVRTHQAPERLCLNVEVDEHSLGDLTEPANYKAVLLDPESNKWFDAMNAKIQSMKDNQVWRMVDLPPNDNRAIRILIAIAAFDDYEIWQIDVKTSFLNSYLDDDIYMVQRKGFIDPKHPRKVCKLQRSIYGLKQASRSWNKRFDKEIKKFGFAQNLDEPCVYQKASGSNVTFLILYVDDIIIMGNHIPMLQSVKSYLGKCFAMKDLREAVFILGIKIYRDRSKRLIGLSQSAYTDKILKRFKMDNSKRGNIPMQERLDLNKSQGDSTPEEVKRMQNVPYASAVGSIMYAVRCTRPDVAFAQNITSHFQHNLEIMKLNLELHAIAMLGGLPKNQRALRYRDKGEYIALSSVVLKSMDVFTANQIMVFKSYQIPSILRHKSAMALCANVSTLKSKHIDIRYHFIKEQVRLMESGNLTLFGRKEWLDISPNRCQEKDLNFLIEQLGMRSMFSRNA